MSSPGPSGPRVAGGGAAVDCSLPCRLLSGILLLSLTLFALPFYATGAVVAAFFGTSLMWLCLWAVWWCYHGCPTGRACCPQQVQLSVPDDAALRRERAAHDCADAVLVAQLQELGARARARERERESASARERDRRRHPHGPSPEEAAAAAQQDAEQEIAQREAAADAAEDEL